MNTEILIARLALARGLISPEAYRAIIERPSVPGMVEDALRGAGLSAEQVDTLRGALHIKQTDVWLGDWRLLRRIGIGGMGSVFEVRHRRTGRRAALKILLPRLGRDPEFTLRFLREARALARISHPNVVHAYDAGKSGDFHFIAMELVEGEDLQRCLEREGCLAPLRSAEIMLEVARALQAIQSAGLIHRDVKPANILIDPAGAVKLTDLGLFHDGLNRDVLWDGTVFGTPQYMSPEQVLGSRKIDIRSDLYSLGATWYHALMGRPVFGGDSLGKMARAQVEATPVPPRDIRPDVPLAIDRLILDLLKKDPRSRPSGPEEVILAIEGILASLGPMKKTATAANGARPRTGPLAADGRDGSRRRVLIAGGALGGLLALVLLFWAGSALLRGRGGELEKRAAPVVGQAAPIQDAKAAEAISSVREVAAMVEASSRRVLDRALPRPPAWLTRKGDPPAPGGIRPDPREERPRPPPGGDQDFPEAVLAWAVQGAMEARTRFLAALASCPRSPPIEVVLRDGKVVRARVPPSASAERALESEDGHPIPLSSLHPASVIAWAEALAPDGPIPDGGAGLAVREGFLPGAKMVVHALAPPLPEPARTFILYGAEDAGRALASAPALTRESLTGNEPGPPLAACPAAEEFLARSLRDTLRERAARTSLRSGLFQEAARAFSDLLSPGEPSPQAEVRKAEWARLRERAVRLSFTSERFFVPGGSPLDPLRGEEVRVRYLFDDGSELHDFRFDPRAWTPGQGALLRTGFGRPGRTGPPDRKRPDFQSAFDTVGLFVPPVTVKGTWVAAREREARIAVGFAGRFAALGADSVLAHWRGELEDGRLPEPPGRAGGAGNEGRRFQVEFLADRAFAGFAGGVRSPIPFEPAAAPSLSPPGRIAIGLEPGASLEDLEITGTPDPVWTEARIEELRNLERR